MATKLTWSPQARADLIDIYVTIGREQPRAAERYLDTIEAKAELLVQQPRMGVRRRDIAPTARMLVERPFLILYEIQPDSDEGEVDEVAIMRVVDGRRDVPSLF